MKLFKINEQQLQLLGDLLLEFPAKYQNIINKGYEVLRGLEEFVHESLTTEKEKSQDKSNE